MVPVDPRWQPDAEPFCPGRVPAEKAILACILVVALAVRLPGLGESLWYDEVFYTGSAFRQPRMLSFLLWRDVHPPLYPLLLLVWTSLFGDGEVVVRLPALLFGLGSLLVAWDLARRWLGPHRALLVAALIALSPAHIWYSHENKVNMLLLLLTAGAVRLYGAAAEAGRPRDWIGATAALLGALYTHAFAVPIAAVVFLWLAWRAGEDRRLVRPTLAAAVATGVAWLPLALLKLSQGATLERGYLRQLSPGELYKLLLVWLPHGNTLRTINPYAPFSELLRQPWFYFLADAVFAVLLARGLARAWRRAKDRGAGEDRAAALSAWSARLLLLWFVLPVAGTAAASLVTSHAYIERNLLIVLPPFLFLLADGASELGPLRLRAALPAFVLIGAAMATASLLVFKHGSWTVYKIKPDWRAAAAYLAQEAAREGRARAFVTTPTNELGYYAPRIGLGARATGPPPRILLRSVGRAGSARALEAAAGEGTGFYLVRNSTWLGSWEEAWRSCAGDARFRILDARRFRGLTVYRFGARPMAGLR